MPEFLETLLRRPKDLPEHLERKEPDHFREKTISYIEELLESLQTRNLLKWRLPLEETRKSASLSITYPENRALKVVYKKQVGEGTDAQGLELTVHLMTTKRRLFPYLQPVLGKVLWRRKLEVSLGSTSNN